MKGFIFLLVILIPLFQCQANVINVNPSGTGDYPTIQEAINNASNGDIIVLQQGIYTGESNRNLDFIGKAITVRGTDPNNPNIVTNTVIDCQGISGSVRRGFYFHNGETNSSKVSGITIKNGYADGSWPQYIGGGIYCSGSSPIIESCRILNNRAEHHGGGISCYESYAKIKNCIISSNSAISSDGGGVYCWKGKPEIIGCIISNNIANGLGGGIFSRENNILVSRCNISSNHCGDLGGGICLIGLFQYNYPQLYNCLITNNICDDGPSAIFMQDVLPVIDHCTIAKNNGYPHLGAIYCNNAHGEPAIITNSILWSNYGMFEGFIKLSFCSFTPTFVDAEGGDFHLSPQSSCINGGDPCYMMSEYNVDYDGNPRILNNRVDIGAYEQLIEEPFIGVYPLSIDFVSIKGQGNPESQTLFVRNDGTGTINWQIIKDCNWLNVSTTDGQSSGDVNRIILSADISELDGGIYTSDLTIFADEAINNPKKIKVTLDVKTPLIELSSKSFQFTAKEMGENPAEQKLTIRNSGVLTLNWAINYDCNWLSVSPVKGSSTGDSNKVTLSVDISKLTAGNYECELVISDTNAINSPQVVTINLTVIGPVIELSGNELEFFVENGQLNPIQQMLRISNQGGGVAKWVLDYECNWLIASHESGEIYAGDYNDVVLTIDANSLTDSFYICNITVSDPNSENGPQSADVFLYFDPIQLKIDKAVDGDVIIIQSGIYKGKYNRDLDFKGKNIILRSIDPNDPNIVASTIIDCNSTNIDFNTPGTEPHRGFYLHMGENSNSMVAGITIMNGYGYTGGGIYCENSSPTIFKCNIMNNFAAIGGGMYFYSSGSKISGCNIINNIGSEGGGIFSDTNCKLLISDSSISGNSSQSSGGGIFNTSDLILKNCLIVDNISGFEGSGINHRFSVENTLTMENCTVANNISPYYEGDIRGNYSANIIMKNSIIWDTLWIYDTNTIVSYCDIKGCAGSGEGWDEFQFGKDGGGNIDIDPCFAAPFNNDYHLQSEIGRWDSYNQIWVEDANTSECIDAGDPNSDWKSELWPHGKRINIGAYGGTPQASMSQSALGNIADLNNDGKVDSEDLRILCGFWLDDNLLLAPNLNRAGLISFLDICIFSDNWLWQE